MHDVKKRQKIPFRSAETNLQMHAEHQSPAEDLANCPTPVALQTLACISTMPSPVVRLVAPSTVAEVFVRCCVKDVQPTRVVTGAVQGGVPGLGDVRTSLPG